MNFLRVSVSQWFKRIYMHISRYLYKRSIKIILRHRVAVHPVISQTDFDIHRLRGVGLDPYLITA